MATLKTVLVEKAERPVYAHTQKAFVCLFFYAGAIAWFVGAWFAQDLPLVALASAGIGVAWVLLALSVHHLTVVDGGDHLAVRFGPLPLFRTTIPYTDIQKVEIGRTPIVDDSSLVRWNLWGRGCVVVHRRKGILRVGTDDAENLARFLEGKISHGPA
jgi:membrane protein YdbS with pleckstrin-like domain